MNQTMFNSSVYKIVNIAVPVTDPRFSFGGMGGGGAMSDAGTFWRNCRLPKCIQFLNERIESRWLGWGGRCHWIRHWFYSN